MNNAPANSSPNGLGRYWLAARPRTLPAAIAPVVVGTAAAAQFSSGRFVLALTVGLLLQVGVNFANDYYDGVRGVDTAERLGPQRAVASGLISAQAMRRAMISVFAAAACVGLVLALLVDVRLLGIGILALLAAVAYSGGPRPYASAGMGELFVFVFFGLVATVGSTYVQDELLHAHALVAAVPMGLLASAILLVNNLRDIPTDSAAGKRTLAVRIGAHGTRWLYTVSVVVAFDFVALTAWVAGSVWPLLGLLAAPLAVAPVRAVWRAQEPAPLIAALGATARLEMAVGALLALGLWLR